MTAAACRYNLVDRDIRSRLQYFDANFQHFGKSCKNVVSQHHVWNGFGGTGELIGDIYELREIDADWLSRNRTQLAELSEERQTTNCGVCRIHLFCQYFPHPHRILNLDEMWLDFGATRSVDDSTSLGSPRGEILIGLTSMNVSLTHSFGVLRFFFIFHDDSPSLDSMKDLFAVCLPAGVVRVIEKSNSPEWVLEDFLVGGGHDDSMGKIFFFSFKRWFLLIWSSVRSFEFFMRDGYGTGLITC